MRIRLLLPVAFLFAGSLSSIRGQCTSQQPITVSCSGFNCQGQYAQPPVADGGPNDDTTFPIRCCGHLVQVYSGGGGCTDAALRSQVAKDGLNFLRLEGVQLMVKDCAGHFTTPTQAIIDIGHWTIDLRNSSDAIHLEPPPRG